MPVTKNQALDYHFGERPGKIEVTPSKPCRTQRDLSLAYTPGVADPCLEIQKNPQDAFKYTARGNLVAVVSNGTAVLGLGDIGALAGKPVMEGKAVLFKRFADVDVFDLEVNSHDPEQIIKLCQLLEPTFGGINLEDIKAPECFHIEETLRKTMKIPVFHDDQHGTAIISGAALLNALEVVGKLIGQVRVVVNGAGASGIACAEHYVRLGVKRENITMCDTKGVIYKGRSERMNPYKERFAKETTLRTLSDAMRGADVFLGCSVKGAVNAAMIRSMAPRPIVFAMANPDPEVTYEEAKLSREDVIFASHACVGRARQRGCAGLSMPSLWSRTAEVRTRIPDSQALRSESAVVGSGCGCEGRNGKRGRATTCKPAVVPRTAGETPGEGARDRAHDDSQGASSAQAGRVSGRG